MKKRLFICALIAICLGIAAFGTTAYFSYEDNTQNVITAGNVKIAVLEWSLTDKSEKIPYENSVTVMPGTELSKIVEIKNVGNQTAWIRISVEKAIVFREGIDETPDLSLITIDFDTENWCEQDGYFYYLKELKPNETTEPLFTKVVFSKDMKNKYQNSKATIDVTAQATQWVHNGETVLDALGWPSED